MRTARGHAIAEVLRTAFEHVRELDKFAPGDVDEVIAATVSSVRGLRPECGAPLGTLAPPSAPVRDPRMPRPTP